MTKKLWIDTDCGVDDSTGILLCLDSPNVEIIGISCIGGNVSLEHVANNVGRTLKVYGKKIPIFKGCRQGLIADPMHIPEIHGTDGLGDINDDDFGTHTVDEPEKEPAPMAIINALRSNPNMDILTLGPLTNLALAIVMAPDVIQNIGHVYIMGGAEDGKGNATRFAEFNFRCDPESACIVLRDIPSQKVTLSTWTLTLKHAITGDVLTSIFHKKDTIMQRWIGATWALPIKYDEGQALMADPIASFLACHPEAILSSNRYKIEIPLFGEEVGMTKCTPDPNGIEVADKIDLDAYLSTLLELLNRK